VFSHAADFEDGDNDDLRLLLDADLAAELQRLEDLQTQTNAALERIDVLQRWLASLSEMAALCGSASVPIPNAPKPITIESMSPATPLRGDSGFVLRKMWTPRCG